MAEDNMERKNGLLRNIAIRLGCPSMWLEECVQEMKLAIWKAGKAPWRTVARYEAIDFIRHYGPRPRRNAYLRNTSYITDMVPQVHNKLEEIEELIDAISAMSKLTEAQKKYLGRYLEDNDLLRWDNTGQVHLSAARKRLRDVIETGEVKRKRKGRHPRRP